MSKQKETKRHYFVYKKHSDHTKITMKRIIGWFFLMIFLSVSVFLVEQNVSTFQASLIPTKNVPAFDGLVMPIQTVPNWVRLSSDEWKMRYSEIPSSKMQKIPKYNPQNLRIPVEQLTWGNSADDAVRNEKITYSVPYMGNYRLDGIEYAGSHPAIDIKIPAGTPVYAIGNGIIKKTSEQLHGYGKHVVIEHINFPSYDNPSVLTTYYSSYSHLESISVTEGSIVRKGDIVGYSGDTGTTTTPHLHFQIDTNTSPWQPFWPFTSKEASDAGLSFTGAVNAGLNQDIAMQHTINPILYIQAYADGQTFTPPPPPSQPPSTPTPPPSSPPVNETTPPAPGTGTGSTQPPPAQTIDLGDYESIILENQQSAFITFDIIGDDTFIPNQPKAIVIKAVTRTGKVVQNYAPDEQIRIDITRGRATLEPNRLNSSDFKNGIATITFTSSSETPVEFMIKTNNLMKESQTIYPGLFADINTAHPHFQAISFLKNEGVIQGYPDGSFKPDNIVSRVEVLKFILEGIEADIQTARSLPFSDTGTNQWYADYLHTAYETGIVEGYPDGTFKPATSVNKVEFLKMLIEAMQIDVDKEVKDLGFVDVREDQWYAPYVQFATEKNIMDIEGDRFRPASAMRRDEVAEAIYRIKMLMLTGANIYSQTLS